MSAQYSAEFALIVLHGPLNSKTIEERIIQRRQYQVLESYLKAAVLPITCAACEQQLARRGRGRRSSSASSGTESDTSTMTDSSDDEADKASRRVFVPEASPATFHIYSKTDLSNAIHKCQHDINVRSVFMLVLADIVLEADPKRGSIHLSPSEKLSFSRLFKDSFLSESRFREKVSLILDTTVMTPSLFDNREKQDRLAELKQYLDSMKFREVLLPLVTNKTGNPSTPVEELGTDLPNSTVSFTRATESLVMALLGSAQNPLSFSTDLLRHSHAVQQAFYKKQESTQIPHIFEWSSANSSADSFSSWSASAPVWWLPNFAKDLLRSNQFPLAALSFGTSLDVAGKLTSAITSTTKKRAPSAGATPAAPVEKPAVQPAIAKGLGLSAAAVPFTPGAVPIPHSCAPPAPAPAPPAFGSVSKPTPNTTTAPMFIPQQQPQGAVAPPPPPPGYGAATTTNAPPALAPANLEPVMGTLLPATTGAAPGAVAHHHPAHHHQQPQPHHHHFQVVGSDGPAAPAVGGAANGSDDFNHSSRPQPDAIQRPLVPPQQQYHQDPSASGISSSVPVLNVNSKAPIPNGTPPAMMKDAYDIPPTKEGALEVADEGIPHKKHSNRRWCVVCETEVCGADNWIAHSTGEKHRRRKENLIASNNPIQANLLSGFATNRVVVPVGPYASAQIRDDRQWCQLCECFIEKGQTWHQHLGTQKHYAKVLATSTPISRAQAQHLCRVCDVQISGERNVQLHVDGNRHRRKVAAARARCGGCGQEFPIREDLDEHRSHCDHNPLPDVKVMSDLMSLSVASGNPNAPANAASGNSAAAPAPAADPLSATTTTDAPPLPLPAGGHGTSTSIVPNVTEKFSSQPLLNLSGGATTTTTDIASAISPVGATAPNSAAAATGPIDHAAILRASKKNTGVIGDGHFHLGKSDMDELESRFLSCFALDSCC